MLASRLSVLYPQQSCWTPSMLEGSMGARQTLSGEHTPEEAGDGELPWPPTKARLVELLSLCGGNVSDLAARVGRNRKQIYRWMDKLGIDRGAGRP